MFYLFFSAPQTRGGETDSPSSAALVGYNGDPDDGDGTMAGMSSMQKFLFKIGRKHFINIKGYKAI